MTKTILSILSIITIISCGTDTSAASSNGINKNKILVDSLHASLSLSIENAKDSVLYVEHILPNKIEVLDSINIKKKKVSHTLSVELTEPNFYRVRFSENNSAFIILEPKSEVNVSSQDPSLFKNNYLVEGSEDSELLKQVLSEINVYSESQLALQLSAEKLPKDDISSRQKLQNDYNKNQKEFNSYLSGFINNHSNSPAVLFTLNFLSLEKDLALYEKIGNDLSPVMPNSIVVKNILSTVDSYKKQLIQQEQVKKSGLNVGSEVPEIELPSPSGEILTLSSLRGNYVLIDFWASWCGPCRRENPNVVKLYNKYHNKGFDILGVSLDNNSSKWQAAIKKDKLTWNHVSDLKGWSSSAARLYNVSSIPFTVLIDPNGKVIGTNLRGQQLEQVLESIFK